MRYIPLSEVYARRRINGGRQRIIRYAPPSVIAPTTVVPTPPPRFTTQQLIEMRDRATAAQWELFPDEFNAAQGREYGDGFAFDLEQTAAENNASDAAVDASFDTTLPAPAKAPNLMPLTLAAIAAYFFL